jgi:hypothetical protein
MCYVACVIGLQLWSRLDVFVEWCVLCRAEGLKVGWLVSQWAKVQHPIVVSNAAGKIGGAEWNSE